MSHKEGGTNSLTVEESEKETEEEASTPSRSHGVFRHVLHQLGYFPRNSSFIFLCRIQKQGAKVDVDGVDGYE
jgi:hypothetical protein